MRILHLIQRFWPARGGAEIHLGKISTYLAQAGHDVTVVTTDALDFEVFWDPRRRRITERDSLHEGVQIRRFPVDHLPFPHLAYPAIRRLLWIFSKIKPLPVPLLHRLARFTPWVPDLWRWLEDLPSDEQFDLVAGMTICFEPLIEAGLRFAQQRQIPFVIYPLTHLGAGAAPAQDALSRFYTMRHQLDLVRTSEAVVAQTLAEKNFLISQGVNQERIAIVGVGVDPQSLRGGNSERFREKHGIQGPMVASISSMSYDKGTIHTVQAIRQLWQQGQQVELVLIGAILDPFRQFLSNLPLQDQQRIHLLGFVDEEEKRDALAATNMFVMPSRTDSFGIAYLEAWLYQKPVIGARTWGVMDVITDGKDGLLVPFGDVSALSKAIAYLLAHPNKAGEMGIRGEQKVMETHTWPHKLHKIEQLYKKLK